MKTRNRKGKHTDARSLQHEWSPTINKRSDEANMNGRWQNEWRRSLQAIDTNTYYSSVRIEMNGHDHFRCVARKRAHSTIWLIIETDFYGYLRPELEYRLESTRSKKKGDEEKKNRERTQWGRRRSRKIVRYGVFGLSLRLDQWPKANGNNEWTDSKCTHPATGSRREWC